MDLGLNGVHVLVTGASDGIGFETVKQFLEHGAYVTAHYNTERSPLTDLQIVVDDLHLEQADVTNEHAVADLFVSATEFFEQEVQVLVVNQGFFPPEDVRLVDMGLDRWKRTMDVNLTGPFLLVREFLQRLRHPHNRYPDMSKVAIVVVGSTSGEFGDPGHVDYSCSKAALQTGFIRTVKNEMVDIAPAGRINAISPGWVGNPMTEALLGNSTLYERALATTPFIATQILVLASSTISGHITGQNSIIAGGLEGRLLNPPA